MTDIVPTGLCGTCAHRRTVHSRRGSRFLLCGLARTDPRYPRYPRLPVLACDGYVPERPADAARPANEKRSEE